MPMLYNTRYSSKRRVTVMIAIVWVLSFTISCPMLFGLNNTGESCLCPPGAQLAPEGAEPWHGHGWWPTKSLFTTLD